MKLQKTSEKRFTLVVSHDELQMINASLYSKIIYIENLRQMFKAKAQRGGNPEVQKHLNLCKRLFKKIDWDI